MGMGGMNTDVMKRHIGGFGHNLGYSALQYR